MNKIRNHSQHNYKLFMYCRAGDMIQVKRTTLTEKWVSILSTHIVAN